MFTTTSHWLTQVVTDLIACQNPAPDWHKSKENPDNQRITVTMEGLDALGGAISQGELGLMEFHLHDLLTTLLGKEK